MFILVLIIMFLKKIHTVGLYRAISEIKVYTERYQGSRVNDRQVYTKHYQRGRVMDRQVYTRPIWGVG